VVDHDVEPAAAQRVAELVGDRLPLLRVLGAGEADHRNVAVFVDRIGGG
jgi:hypothetical protein